ncbi:MAG: hypothetical protein ACOCP8_04825 [archaeon]
MFDKKLNENFILFECKNCNNIVLFSRENFEKFKKKIKESDIEKDDYHLFVLNKLKEYLNQDCDCSNPHYIAKSRDKISFIKDFEIDIDYNDERDSDIICTSYFRKNMR